MPVSARSSASAVPAELPGSSPLPPDPAVCLFARATRCPSSSTALARTDTADALAVLCPALAVLFCVFAWLLPAEALPEALLTTGALREHAALALPISCHAHGHSKATVMRNQEAQAVLAIIKLAVQTSDLRAVQGQVGVGRMTRLDA